MLFLSARNISFVKQLWLRLVLILGKEQNVQRQISCQSWIIIKYINKNLDVALDVEAD